MPSRQVRMKCYLPAGKSFWYGWLDSTFLSPVLCVLPCSRKSFDSDEMGLYMYDAVFCDLSMLCDCKGNTLAALEVFQSYKGFQKWVYRRCHNQIYQKVANVVKLLGTCLVHVFSLLHVHGTTLKTGKLSTLVSKWLILISFYLNINIKENVSLRARAGKVIAWYQCANCAIQWPKPYHFQYSRNWL